MKIYQCLPIGRGFRFRLTRMSLRHSQERVLRAYDVDIKTVREKGGKWDDIDSIESMAHFEWQMTEEEIQKLETRYYLSCAGDLSVETDIKPDEWLENRQLGGKSLSVAAIARIRQNLRKERMESRQEWLVFIPLLSLFAALVAAITGIITVTKDKLPPPPTILQSRPAPPNAR